MKHVTKNMFLVMVLARGLVQTPPIRGDLGSVLHDLTTVAALLWGVNEATRAWYGKALFDEKIGKCFPPATVLLFATERLYQRYK